MNDIHKSLPSLNSPIQCNILLLGRTGAGKSSFANYLFEEDVFRTGSGEPVTGWENNFQNYPLNIKDITVNVYDSVGLETDNFEEWENQLTSFLDETNIQQTNANQLLHTTYYVINAASSRLLAQEAEILESFYKKYKIPTFVILTNCDISSEDKISAIESEITNLSLESIRVCSISRNTRGGGKQACFGRDKAIQKMLESSYELVGRKLSEQLLCEIIKFYTETKETIKARIQKTDLSIITLIKNEFDDSGLETIFSEINVIDDFSELIPIELQNYKHFLDSFSIDYRGREFMDELFFEIDEIIESIDFDNISLIKRLENAVEKMDEPGFFNKLSGLFEAGASILTIKQTLKSGIDEIFNPIIHKMNRLLWNIQINQG